MAGAKIIMSLFRGGAPVLRFAYNLSDCSLAQCLIAV